MKLGIVSGCIRHARGRVVDGAIVQSRIGNRVFCKGADIEDYRDGSRQNSTADRPVNPGPNRSRRVREARK